MSNNINPRLFTGRSEGEEAALSSFERSLGGRSSRRDSSAPARTSELPTVGPRLQRVLSALPDSPKPVVAPVLPSVPPVSPLPPASSPLEWSFRPFLMAGGAAAALMASTVVCAGMVKTGSALTDVMAENDRYPQVHVPHFSSTPRKSGNAEDDPVPTPVGAITDQEELEDTELATDLSSKIRKRLEELDAAPGDLDFDIVRPDGSIDGRDLYIGGAKPVKIASYSKVADIATAQEYFDFLIATVESPTELTELLHPYFLPFNPLSSILASTPKETLERGNGDCDDYSEIVRKGLLSLGVRKGTNYRPRVIGQVPKNSNVGHAIAIYQDGGKWYSIDQGEPRSFARIDEASPLFVPASEARFWVEVLTRDPGRSFRLPIDENLTPDYTGTFMGDLSGERYAEGFDFTTLPDGWEKYRHSVLCFNPDAKFECDETVLLEQGLLAQIFYTEGEVSMENYSRGQLSQRFYRSGPYVAVQYERGKPAKAMTFSGEEVGL